MFFIFSLNFLLFLLRPQVRVKDVYRIYSPERSHEHLNVVGFKYYRTATMTMALSVSITRSFFIDVVSDNVHVLVQYSFTVK